MNAGVLARIGAPVLPGRKGSPEIVSPFFSAGLKNVNSAGLSGLPSPAQPWRGPESSPSRRTGIGGRRRLGSRERSQSRLDKFGTPAHSLRSWERAGQQTPGDRFATMDLVASLA